MTDRRCRPRRRRSGTAASWSGGAGSGVRRVGLDVPRHPGRRRAGPAADVEGLRYVCAAVVLAPVLAWRGGFRRLRVTPRQLAGAALLGLMLPVLGNGLVSVGENLGAPSGITALLDRGDPADGSPSSGSPPATARTGSPCSACCSASAGWRSWCWPGTAQGAGEIPLLAAADHRARLDVLGVRVLGAAPAAAAARRVRDHRLRDALRRPGAAGARRRLRGAVPSGGVRRADLARAGRTSSCSGRWWPSPPTSGCCPPRRSRWWPPTPTSTRSSRCSSAALILSEPVTGAVVVGGGIVVLAVAIVISAERPRRKPVPEPEAEAAGPGR